MFAIVKMVFRKVYVFPILFGCWFPITVIITYSVSVLSDHVKPVFPYISDTGTWTPESCIFGIMLTTGALLLWIISYIRFVHLAEIQQKYNKSRILKALNKYSLYLATLSGFGCLIVANFQVSVIFVVHLLGAAVCFGFALMYQMSQVILSFSAFPAVGHKAVNISRFLLTLISIITFLITGILGYISLIHFKGKDMTKWEAEDGGYLFHVISAVSEYILVASTVLFYVTFIQEFKSLEIHEPIVSVRMFETND